MQKEVVDNSLRSLISMHLNNADLTDRDNKKVENRQLTVKMNHIR